MKPRTALVTLISLVVLATNVWAQGLPTAKPETVGLSSERLERVSRALRSEIEAGKFPGAVALVARKGQVVYFESFGVRDPATGAPMGKDAMPVLHDQALRVGGGDDADGGRQARHR